MIKLIVCDALERELVTVSWEYFVSMIIEDFRSTQQTTKESNHESDIGRKNKVGKAETSKRINS
jgi:hypothetical protein